MYGDLYNVFRRALCQGLWVYDSWSERELPSVMHLSFLSRPRAIRIAYADREENIKRQKQKQKQYSS